MTNMEPHVAADNDNKAQDVFHYENGQQSDDEKRSLEEDALNYFTPAEQKKIIHRLDRRLVTVVGVMYCVSLMDRSNLSNAAIAGMNTELELTVGMRYVSDFRWEGSNWHALTRFDRSPSSLWSSSSRTSFSNLRRRSSLARSVHVTSLLVSVSAGEP